MSRRSAHRRQWRWLLALAVVGAVSTAATNPDRILLGSPAERWGRTTGQPVSFDELDQVAEGEVVDALGEIEVRAPASMIGFDRDRFGQRWSDDVRVAGGRDGCDTRNDVLRRDLDELRVQQGTQGCVALSGTLTDPYTGVLMPFERGEDSGSRIHVDHLVSLGDAWVSGAQELSVDRRRDLANDPLNLWAVDGRQNQAKGAEAADGWLPADEVARCRLVAHQVAVKTRYELSMTPAEHAAITRVLEQPTCEGQALPTEALTSPPAPQREQLRDRPGLEEGDVP